MADINIGKFINNMDSEDLTSEKLQGVVNNVYAKAISDHKKKQKEVEENTKEQDEETVKFVKANHDRLKAHKKPLEKDIDKDDATDKDKVAKEINESFSVVDLNTGDSFGNYSSTEDARLKALQYYHLGLADGKLAIVDKNTRKPIGWVGRDGKINKSVEENRSVRRSKKRVNESAAEYVETDRETGATIYKNADTGRFSANYLTRTVSGSTVDEVKDKLSKLQSDHISHFRNLPESKKINEETILPGNIYDVLVKKIPAKDIDHYNSDLYVRKTPQSTEIINKLSTKSLLSTFKDNIDGDIWYELPFCYTPRLEKKESKKVNEDKEPFQPMTIEEYANKFLDGDIDMDIYDEEIDMGVCFVYNFNEAPKDNYEKFLSILGKNVMVKDTPKVLGFDSLLVDLSGFYKPYNKKINAWYKKNGGHDEFDGDEGYLDLVLATEGLVSGYYTEEDYKDLCDIFESRKIKEERSKKVNESASPKELYWNKEEALKDIWGLVCEGDDRLEDIRYIFESGLLKPNEFRYDRFGAKHSLIMGALRNGNYKTVELLKSLGEKILKSEVEEYKDIMAKRVYSDETVRGALDEDGSSKDSYETTIDSYEKGDFKAEYGTSKNGDPNRPYYSNLNLFDKNGEVIGSFGYGRFEDEESAKKDFEKKKKVIDRRLDKKVKKEPKGSLDESRLAYYKYRGCTVRETPSTFVAINEHGLNIGESPTAVGAEGIIDDYLEKQGVKAVVGGQPKREGSFVEKHPNIKLKKESLKEELSDEEIFDILGIEQENRTNSKHLLSQFRRLHKKYGTDSIWLKGDVGSAIKGKVIGRSNDLAVVESTYHKSDIKGVSPEELNKIISDREPRGLFLAKEGEVYVAVDNSTGNAWTEEFQTKGEAIKWLKGADFSGVRESKKTVKEAKAPYENPNFDEKKFGKYFDDNNKLIPELADEYFSVANDSTKKTHNCKRNSRNVRFAVKELQKKGYDQEEANDLALKIFDEHENDTSRSLEWYLDKILSKKDYNKEYGIEESKKSLWQGRKLKESKTDFLPFNKLSRDEQGLADYIYDEYKSYSGRHNDYLSIDLSDRESVIEDVKEYYTDDMSDEQINKVIDLLDTSGEVKIYEDSIQLSDDPVLNFIEPSLPEDNSDAWEAFDYYLFEAVGVWLSRFEDECGVEISQEGRSGRHIVIPETVKNFINYPVLVRRYDEFQNDFINTMNSVTIEELGLDEGLIRNLPEGKKLTEDSGKRYEQTITISPKVAERIEYWLSDNSDDRLTEDDTYTETASFPNGMEVDVKCCGSDEDTAWTEAILFHNGYEVTFTEPEDEYFGDWELEDDTTGNTYVVHVVKGVSESQKSAVKGKVIGRSNDLAETESLSKRRSRKLKESQTQELEKIFKELNADYGVDVDAKLSEYTNGDYNLWVKTLYTEAGWKKFEKWLNKQGIFDKSTHFAISRLNNWPDGYWTTGTERFNTIQDAKKFADKKFKSADLIKIEDDRNNFSVAGGETVKFKGVWMTENNFFKLRDSGKA